MQAANASKLQPCLVQRSVPEDPSSWSRRERGRRWAEQLRRAREGADDRTAYVNAQMSPGEWLVVAPRGPRVHQFFTERRILLVWQRLFPLRDWVHDSVSYEEVSSWRWGREHDGRPFVVLSHPPHVRLEWVPARRFLWFRWGNAEGPVAHIETKIAFGSKRDPAIEVVQQRLEERGDN
jgi:hypothetical protein